MNDTMRAAIRDGNMLAEAKRRLKETYCDCGGVRSLTPCTADCAWRRK